MSPADADLPYTWRSEGRSLTTAAIVGMVWTALAAAYFTLDAALWLLACLAFFTLPALYDLLTNRGAGMTLDATRLHWFSGKREATLGLREIDHVRLDTRLDLSVRATAVLINGRNIRLPFEATPPQRELEAALEQRGVRTRRHHFSPIG